MSGFRNRSKTTYIAVIVIVVAALAVAYYLWRESRTERMGVNIGGERIELEVTRN